VRIAARILRDGSLVTRLAGSGRTDGAVQALRWRPRKVGRLRWCVRAADRAGHRSKESCAALIVR